MKKQLLIPMILAGALTLTACGQMSVPETVKVQAVGENVIRVSSREQVKTEPDIAELRYSVYSQASDAQTCQTQNNADLNKVIEVLKAQGIDEKSIQTSNYGLNPVYDWESGKTITGYEMETEVTVSDIPMEEVGSVISESIDAGINTIRSVTYKASTYDDAYQEALAKAIDAAKVKADAMAAAGNCKLGRIVNIEEYSNNQQAKYNSYAASGGVKEEMALADMGVMPGQIEVEASITVEFEIQ